MKHCCEMMTQNVSYRCVTHPDPFDCPDQLIHFDPKTGKYGIIVHDGGTSCVEIAHCPWCGGKLEDKARTQTKQKT
jgi:hypothetical protein